MKPQRLRSCAFPCNIFVADMPEYETQRFSILFPASLEADVQPGDIIDYRIVGYFSPTINREATKHE